MIENIRKNAVTEEIDYNLVMSALADYAHPRDVITRLLKSGALIRVKKGLYVFGPAYARQPYSLETLANLIYGPSYISLEYALYFYGMLPERIEVVTSMTNKRNKFFKTSVGNFSYTYIHSTLYPLGVDQVSVDDTHHVLIASREKALVDTIYRAHGIATHEDAMTYLIDDLRIEEAALKVLNLRRLRALANAYGTIQSKALYNAVKENV